MKTLSFYLSLLLVVSLQAQITVPQPSPTAHLEQTVGLTQLTIDYSRPSMRGRTIMGDLVPFGEIWRTGANKNTTFTFGDAVQVGGQPLEAGTYALYTRPGKENWTLYFYRDTNNWGIPQNWEAEKIAATLTLPVKMRAKVKETFTISVDELSNNGAQIILSWEQVDLAIPLAVPTQAKAMASIKSSLEKNPSAGDLYNAASYYFGENMDLKQAEQWISKAVQLENDKYWMFRLQAKVLAALNQKDKAIEAAKKSLVLAEKAGNPDYVRMNKADIKAWGN